ncbi:hypothetical protein DXG01_000584 [Tephrocybe rancida]|nr:hypothetical protein DXG01_000584 [Tephrocybe rancida]
MPKNVNKVVEAATILGDVVTSLASLASLIKPASREEWFKDIQYWKTTCPFTCAKGDKMKPQEVIGELDRQTAHRNEDNITMGFGLPAVIGAEVAAPHKTVVDIDGDASFSMTAMEPATTSQYNIGVKVLLLNNEFQGMVL